MRPSVSTIRRSGFSSNRGTQHGDPGGSGREISRPGSRNARGVPERTVSISPKLLVGAIETSGPACTRIASNRSSWSSVPPGFSSARVRTAAGGSVWPLESTSTRSFDVPICVRSKNSTTPPDTVTRSPTETPGAVEVKTNRPSEVAGSPSESGSEAEPTSDWR